MPNVFAYGHDLAADGTETLAQAELMPDGTMSFVIVQLLPSDTEGSTS